MKKAILILLMMFAFMKPVHASVPPCFPFGAGVMGVGAPTVAFYTGFAAFALLPVAIIELQDQHVWEGMFPVVQQSYPGDKPQYQPVSHTPYHVKSRFGTDSIRSD